MSSYSEMFSVIPTYQSSRNTGLDDPKSGMRITLFNPTHIYHMIPDQFFSLLKDYGRIEMDKRLTVQLQHHVAVFQGKFDK